MVSTENITTVGEEDREFIRDVIKLTPDKKALVKGIVIGIQLEDGKEKKSNGEKCIRNKR